MSDQQNMNLLCSVVDLIQDSPVTNTIAKPTCEFSREPFDIVVAMRILLQLQKTTREFVCQRLIGVPVELQGPGRKDHLKHPIAPYAS